MKLDLSTSQVTWGLKKDEVHTSAFGFSAKE
jgi:hypothetical protein